MCQCASCKATDRLQDDGFAAWPRGNPAGLRKSKAEYSAHVSFGESWGKFDGAGNKRGEKEIPDHYRRIPKEPVYPCTGTPGCGPIPPAPKWLHDWINRDSPKYQAPEKPQAPKPALAIVPKSKPGLPADLADFIARMAA